MHESKTGGEREQPARAALSPCPISLNPGMVELNPAVDKNPKQFMLVKVRNTGATPTTITTLSFVTCESWWKRRRFKWTEGGVVMKLITAQSQLIGRARACCRLDSST
jgi:hypothetical protein